MCHLLRKVEPMAKEQRRKVWFALIGQMPDGSYACSVTIPILVGKVGKIPFLTSHGALQRKHFSSTLCPMNMATTLRDAHIWLPLQVNLIYSTKQPRQCTQHLRVFRPCGRQCTSAVWLSTIIALVSAAAGVHHYHQQRTNRACNGWILAPMNSEMQSCQIDSMVLDVILRSFALSTIALLLVASSTTEANHPQGNRKEDTSLNRISYFAYEKW